MSRIGKLPIRLPKGVTVNISDTHVVTTSGPHGTLSRQIPVTMDIIHIDDRIEIKPKVVSKQARATHGLMRTLVNNMVVGVSEKFTKILQLKGVGYRAQVKGNQLVLSLGFSHEINLDIPNEIEVNVEANTSITIKGIEKEQVGLFASKIRNLRIPEPYNGKGVLYDGEILVRKAGKVGK